VSTDEKLRAALMEAIRRGAEIEARLTSAVNMLKSCRKSLSGHAPPPAFKKCALCQMAVEIDKTIADIEKGNS